MVHSHTSLSLWRLCPRRWYHRYVLKEYELPGEAATFSTHMIHAPHAEWFAPEAQVARKLGKEQTIDWNRHMLDRYQELGWDVASVVKRSPILTESVAKSILSLLERLELDYEAVETTHYLTLPGGSLYSARADGIVRQGGLRYTLDLKFETSNWTSASRPWPIKPLSPFDDQFLGQAITAKADGFMRITIQGDRKSGNLNGPIVEEALLDAALMDEWFSETSRTAASIDTCLAARDPSPADFPKHDNACRAYGHLCSYYQSCKIGFRTKQGGNDAEGGN